MADAKKPALIKVVTTAPGTTKERGLVPIDTPLEVEPRMFSMAWMKPTTRAEEEKAEAELERREALKNGG